MTTDALDKGTLLQQQIKDLQAELANKLSAIAGMFPSLSDVTAITSAVNSAYTALIEAKQTEFANLSGTYTK